MTLDRWLDPAVVARRLGVTSVTVRNWILCGKIPFIKTPAGRYKISQAVLVALLAEKHTKAKGTAL